MQDTIEISSINVKNPITGKELYSIIESSDELISNAFRNARNVQEKIRNLSIKERIKEVLKIRDWVIDNREKVITRLVQECGKSRVDAFTSEIFEICDVIDHYTKVSTKHLKDRKMHTPIVLMGKKSQVWYEPMGTILVITPWNYPFYQGLVPSLLSFISGNATILKPSEITPLKGMMEEMIKESGFLKDAIQVVYGGKDTGKKLIDQRPDKIHFTGSCNSGKKIMEQASQHLIPVDLELGGKDPSIIFDDVVLERTVNGVMWGGFTTAGQSCTSIERCYVQSGVYDEFVKMIVDKTQKLRASYPERNPEQPDDCDVGCVTTEFQLITIEKHIQDAVEKGARVMCGGTREKGSHHFPPTIIVDVNHDMLIMQDETFGPVIPIMKFTSEEEAIKLANDSPYGLSASVWSKDMKRAERVARKIITGNVSINNHMLTEGNPALPFGGTKQSGFGRYKGEWGLHTFSNVKSVLFDKQSKMIEPHWYPFTKTKYQLLSDIVVHLFSKSRNWIKFGLTGLKLDSIGTKEKIK